MTRFFAAATLTGWTWDKNFVQQIHLGTKMKFLGQGFGKLEHEQDRQTRTETDATERITTQHSVWYSISRYWGRSPAARLLACWVTTIHVAHCTGVCSLRLQQRTVALHATVNINAKLHRSATARFFVFHDVLTLSPPIPVRLYTLPYWSNTPVVICHIRGLWRSGLSARAPKCQKLKIVG